MLRVALNSPFFAPTDCFLELRLSFARCQCYSVSARPDQTVVVMSRLLALPSCTSHLEFLRRAVHVVAVSAPTTHRPIDPSTQRPNER